MSSSFPMYDDIGIRLSGVLSGMLVQTNGCFAVDRQHSDTPIILVLPRGSKRHRDGFILPERNGGKAFRTGNQVMMRGGYIEISDALADEFRHFRCKGEAFIVNHAGS